MEKNKKKDEKNRENTVAGKHCYNQKCYVWGATMLFPHHLQSNIVYKKKICSGINCGVLKLTRRPQLSKTIWSGDKEKICISEQKKYKEKNIKNNKLTRGLVVARASLPGHPDYQKQI